MAKVLTPLAGVRSWDNKVGIGKEEASVYKPLHRHVVCTQRYTSQPVGNVGPRYGSMSRLRVCPLTLREARM